MTFGADGGSIKIACLKVLTNKNADGLSFILLKSLLFVRNFWLNF